MALLHDKTGAEFGQQADTYEQLSPFLVRLSAAEILGAHPELEQLYGLPADLFEEEILTDENLRARGVSRETRRSKTVEYEIHVAAKAAYLSVGHVLSRLEEPSWREPHFRQLIREWEESRGVRADSHIYLSVALEHIRPAEAAAFIEGVNAHAAGVQERVLEHVGDSPAEQYHLLKSLVSVQSEEVMQDLEAGCQSEDFQALRWLNLMALMKADGKQAPVYEKLHQGLGRGDYDVHIAYDMLEYARQNDGNGHTPTAVAAFRSLVMLGEQAAGAPADADMTARLAEGLSLGLWSKEQQVAVYKQRKFLSHVLGFLYSTVTDFTHEVIAAGNHDYRFLADKYFDKLAGLEQPYSARIIRDVGGTAVAPLKPKRRREIGAEQDCSVDENGAIVESEETAERPPKTLMYVGRDGLLHQEGSEEFRDLIRDYLNKHKNTPYLEEDLRRTLEYLSRLDLSNGTVPGLKKITNGFAPVCIDGDSLQLLPVWEFKPKEAQGLSLKSNAATRTRIILSVVPGAETLAIRDIGRRTDNPKSRRAIHRRSGHRRR